MWKITLGTNSKENLIGNILLHTYIRMTTLSLEWKLFSAQNPPALEQFPKIIQLYVLEHIPIKSDWNAIPKTHYKSTRSLQ